MRLFPTSLFRQNLLLIIVLILLGQISSGLIFYIAIQKPRVTMLAALTAHQVTAMQAAAKQMPEAALSAFIQEMNNKQDIQILPASSLSLDNPQFIQFDEPDSFAVRMFVRKLDQELGNHVEMTRWSEATHSLWIGLILADQPFWLRLSSRQFDPVAPWVLVQISLASTVLALLGAIFISRRINRPMARLVHAAELLGKGEQPPTLDEHAPDEIATVSASFNRLALNLAQMDSERTIMLAGVSHDLRTPLTKLRLALDLSERRLEPELMLQMVRYVEDIDSLLDQFLDFARVGSDEVAQKVDINALIQQTAQAYSRQDTSFSVHLAITPPLFVRPRAFQRLLVNLMDNAVKYGETNLALRSKLQDDHWQLSILDGGPGIAFTDAERLLQPFTRADDARQGKPGAGLGLAIVKRIVELHQGQLQLLPRADGAGGGLEVRVSLPIASQHSW